MTKKSWDLWFGSPPWASPILLRRTPIQHCTSCRPPIFKANIPFEFFLQDLHSFTKILNVNGKADSRTKCRILKIRGNSVWRIFPCRTFNFFEQIHFAFLSIYLQIDKICLKFGEEILEKSQFMSMSQVSGRTHRIVFESWSWSRRRTRTKG